MSVSQGLPVREPVATDRPLVSFLQLRPRLVGLLITGLQQEADPVNCQAMLGTQTLPLLSRILGTGHCEQLRCNYIHGNGTL